MDAPAPVSTTSTRFMDRLRVFIRSRNLAYRTEQTYCHWVSRFIRYHNYQSQHQMHPRDIEPFLTHLAVEKHVAISTQKTALNALVLLFREFLGLDVGQLDFGKASRPQKLPTVLSQAEATAVIQKLTGVHKLIVQLMYGSGLRILEAVRLRVKDVDFSQSGLMVQDTKGGKPRRTLLPRSLAPVLDAQIVLTCQQHQDDLAAGFGRVYLPDALARKYFKASQEPEWQYLFPADHLSVDPRSGVECRHHLGEQQVQRAVKRAAGRAGIKKRVTSHTFRHSFATQLLRQGTDLKNIQEILEHTSFETTQTYTRVVGLHERGMVSLVYAASC